MSTRVVVTGDGDAWDLVETPTEQLADQLAGAPPAKGTVRITARNTRTGEMLVWWGAVSIAATADTELAEAIRRKRD